MTKKKNWQRRLLIVGAFFLPFAILSIIVFLPALTAPPELPVKSLARLFATFLPSQNERERGNLDLLSTIITVYGLSILPGLLCLLLVVRGLVYQIVCGIIYIPLMLLLMYIYFLIIGLMRSGYL